MWTGSFIRMQGHPARRDLRLYLKNRRKMKAVSRCSCPPLKSFPFSFFRFVIFRLSCLSWALLRLASTFILIRSATALLRFPIWDILGPLLCHRARAAQNCATPRTSTTSLLTLSCFLHSVLISLGRHTRTCLFVALMMDTAIVGCWRGLANDIRYDGIAIKLNVTLSITWKLMDGTAALSMVLGPSFLLLFTWV